MIRVFRTTGLLLVVLLLGGFSPSAAPDNADGCPAQCEEWYEYTVDSMVHYTGTGGDPYANAWFCEPGVCHAQAGMGECTGNHFRCYMALSEIPVERFALEVPRMGEADLKAVLARNPKSIRYNAERGVLQLTGCGERVLAQAALRPEQSAALAE